MKLKWVLTAVVAVAVALVVAGYAVLASLDVEQYRGRIEAEAKKATGRDLTLAGPIDLKVSLTPAITVDDVTVSNADWGSRPEMVTLKRFELQAALLPLLAGEVRLQRLILVEPDILLETDAEGHGNWILQVAGEAEAAPAPSEEKGDLKLSFEEVRIEGGSLTYRDGKSGQETRVQLRELSAKADGAGEPIALNARGSYNEQPFALEGSVGSFTQLDSGPFPVKLTAEAGGATVALDGSIAQPKSGQGIDLTVSAKGDELGALSALAGTPVPALGAYDLRATITQEGEAYKLSDVSAKLAGSDIAGDATIAMAGGRPSLQGNFTSQLIDLTRLTPAGAEGAAPSGGAGDGAASPYVFTEEPLPLDGLRAADAELSLQAAKVRLQDKMELDNLQVTLALQGGRLQIAPLSADFSGGKVDAAVELDGSQAAPPLSTTLKVDRLDYGRLLRTMELDDTVAGTLDVDVDVKGKGGSMRAIASSLNGHSEIVSNEGVITNRLLKFVAVGLGDVLGPLLGGDRDARLNCMISRFDIRGGVATSRALVVDTEQFTISGGGTVDLRTEKLDLNFDTATREPSIASLAVPFMVTGTLKSPSVSPDPVGTALGVAKAAGTVINPVAGLGVLIGSQVGGGGDQNPCVVAVDSGAASSSQGSTIESITKGAGDAAEGAAGAVEDAVKGVGEGLKRLFGD
ncbi:MAG: AsmA family protein [Kiloniellales bacterium]